MRAIGRLHLDGAQRLIPKVRYLLQHRVEIARSVAFDERDGRVGRCLLAEQEGEFGGFARDRNVNLVCIAPQGSRPPPTRFDRGLRIEQCLGFGERSVAADELGAVGGARLLPASPCP